MIAAAWALIGLMFCHAVLMGIDPALCIIGCEGLNPKEPPPALLAPDPSEADAHVDTAISAPVPRKKGGSEASLTKGR